MSPDDDAIFCIIKCVYLDRSKQLLLETVMVFQDCIITIVMQAVYILTMNSIYFRNLITRCAVFWWSLIKKFSALSADKEHNTEFKINQFFLKQRIQKIKLFQRSLGIWICLKPKQMQFNNTRRLDPLSKWWNPTSASCLLNFYFHTYQEIVTMRMDHLGTINVSMSEADWKKVFQHYWPSQLMLFASQQQ